MMKHTIFPRLSLSALLTLVFLLLSSVTSADAEDVQAELIPDTFSIDEAATLQITIKDVQNADIELPDVDGLIFHSRGKSSQIQIVNGAVASTAVYSYLVEPVKEGRYEIPPIRIDHGNDTLHTEPIVCTVTGSSAGRKRQPSEPPGASPDVSLRSFITLTPLRDKIYRGEVIPATIKVYFKEGTRVNQLTLPRLQDEGLLIDELSSNPPQVREVIDNVAYSVLVWDTFITGIKEGVHESTVALDATVLVPSRTRSTLPGFGSGFFSDDFFDNMFTNYSSTPVHVTSEKTAVEVMPLPGSAKPESFSGAVGRFTMKVDARPTTIDPGEPITLTMSVAGTGNFAGVEAPTLSDAGGIKVYSPTAEFTPDQSPYSGTKRFQQAIIITDPSARSVPPVIFSYFDPDTHQYRTLFSDPIPISIKKLIVEDGASTAPVVKQSAKSAESADREKKTEPVSVSLIPVKLEPGTLVEKIRPPFLTAWFVAAMSLCVILISGLFGYRMYASIQAASEQALFRKILMAKQKETLSLLDGLDPAAPGYPEQARKPVADLLIIHRKTASRSLTTADVSECYGPDSAAAELFRLGDGALYGKQERSSSDWQELHEKIRSFVAHLS